MSSLAGVRGWEPGSSQDRPSLEAGSSEKQRDSTWANGKSCRRPCRRCSCFFHGRGCWERGRVFFKIFFIFLFIYLRQGGKERVRVSMSRGGRAEADSL